MLRTDIGYISKLINIFQLATAFVSYNADNNAYVLNIYIVGFTIYSPIQYSSVGCKKIIYLKTVFPLGIPSVWRMIFDIYKITNFEFVWGPCTCVILIRSLSAKADIFLASARAYLMTSQSRRLISPH